MILNLKNIEGSGSKEENDLIIGKVLENLKKMQENSNDDIPLSNLRKPEGKIEVVSNEPAILKHFDASKDFLDWALQESLNDSKVDLKKLNIFFDQMEENILGTHQLGEIVVHEKMVIENQHPEYLSTIRHEIEHYRFDALGSYMDLTYELANLGEEKTKILFNKFTEELKESKSYLYELFEDEIEKLKNGDLNLAVDFYEEDSVFLTIINESIAYFKGDEFAYEKLSEFIINDNLPDFFQTMRAEERLLSQILELDKHKDMTAEKERKMFMDEIVEYRDLMKSRSDHYLKDIVNILSFLKKVSPNNFYPLLVEVYEKHGVDIDFSQI